MIGIYASDGELTCDGVALSAIAADVGTPLYVYSGGTLRQRYAELDRAFGDYPHSVHYALKANSSLGIATLLKQIGSAADANSIWEIELARRAGFQPSEIVFTGVGKSFDELECAVALGVRAINVESGGELSRVETIAQRIGRQARVAIRINPDIDARSHPHISTGLKINKFGMPVEAAREVIAAMPSRPSLRLVAVHVHVGSQITDVEPLRSAAHFLAGIAEECRAAGVPLEYVDVGGGLGIAYDDRPAVSLGDYVAAVLAELKPIGLPVVVELGRAIVGPAGALVARVVDLKRRNAISEFAVVDAGMTELLRPALYGAYHRIEPVVPSGEAPSAYEIVGPVCESADVLGRDRELPRLEVGDLLAVRDAGAYGSAMASNYNRRPIPAEVLVDEGQWRVIRRRQTIEDMVRLES